MLKGPDVRASVKQWNGHRSVPGPGPGRVHFAISVDATVSLDEAGQQEIAIIVLQILNAHIPGAVLSLKDGEVARIEGEICDSENRSVVGDWSITRESSI